MAIGFRIGRERPRVERALVEKFSALAVANISDVMGRMTAGGARLRPIGAARLAGPGLAVKTRPGDNLMVHKAIQVAQPGDVIVVDAGGDLTNAIIGERMATAAHRRGVAGFVIDGAVRDAAVLRTHPMPVFAAGITHRGPHKTGPGEINFPIAIDGMVIESGDLIVGDDDGVLCVPIGEAERVYAAARAVAEEERATAATGSDRSWIDPTLRRLGCEMPDDGPERS